MQFPNVRGTHVRGRVVGMPNERVPLFLSVEARSTEHHTLLSRSERPTGLHGEVKSLREVLVSVSAPTEKLMRTTSRATDADHLSPCLTRPIWYNRLGTPQSGLSSGNDVTDLHLVGDIFLCKALHCTRNPACVSPYTLHDVASCKTPATTSGSRKNIERAEIHSK